LKKLFKTIFYLIAIGIVGVAGFKVYRGDNQRFIVKEADAIVYTNNFTNSKLSTISEFKEASSGEPITTTQKMLIKLAKEIKILKYNDTKTVGVIDGGFSYFLVKYKYLSEYYDLESNGIYRLKEEHRQEVEKLSKDLEERLSKIDKNDITRLKGIVNQKHEYLKSHRGFFITGASPEVIDEYLALTEKQEKNEDLLRHYDKTENSFLSGILLNKEEKLKPLNAVVYKLIPDQEDLVIDFKFYGNFNFIENLKRDKDQENKLLKYVNKNVAYLRVNNVTEVLRGLLKLADNDDSFAQILNLPTGNILRDLDGEVVYDLNRKDGIFLLKSDKTAKFIFSLLGGSEKTIDLGKDYKLKLKDEYLVLNKELQENPKPMRIKDNEFLYLDYSLVLNKNVNASYICIGTYDEEKNNLGIQFKASKEDIKTIIKAKEEGKL